MTKSIKKRGRPRGSNPATGKVQSVDRALDLLDMLARQPELTLSEIAEGIGQPISTTHRLLATLAPRGMIEADATAEQRWSIGPGAWRLGTAFLRGADLTQRARPVLHALAQATGETANLALPADGAALLVAQAPGTSVVRAALPIGTRMAADGSALGKVLLAFDAQVNSTQANSAQAEATTAMADEIARIRTRGFAVDDQGHTPGMRCIAAPVRDHSDTVVAAISISGPVQDISAAHLKTLGAAVTEAARRLSESLGAPSGS